MMIVYKVCSVDADGKRVSLYPFGRILEYKEGVDIVPVEGDGPLFTYDDIDDAYYALSHSYLHPAAIKDTALTRRGVEIWKCEGDRSEMTCGWTRYVHPDHIYNACQEAGIGMVLCDSIRLIERIAVRGFNDDTRANFRREEETV